MPLLGWPLLVTLGLLLVGTVALLFTLWSRLPGGRLLRAGQRIGLLLLTQVATVLLVAAALNNWAYFYGSWADLVGTSAATPAPSSGRGAPQALGPPGHPAAAAAAPSTVTQDTTAAGVTSWSSPSQWATRGRLAAVHVTGLHSTLGEQALVYLPPQYFQPRYAQTRFPGVEVFTGYPGTTQVLVSRMHYPDLLLAQITAHRAAPMVLVMLRPTITPPRDTECTDVPGGPQALTYFAEDVPRAISRAYRVSPTRWGAMGDSTGGYCATKVAMTHSDVFPVAVALSGYFHTLRDSTTGDLWGGSRQLRELNDLEWLLRHEPPPPIAVYASIGSDERGHTGLADTRLFASLVRSPMSVTTVVVPGGAHNFRSWNQAMPGGLDFLSAHLA